MGLGACLSGGASRCQGRGAAGRPLQGACLEAPTPPSCTVSQTHPAPFLPTLAPRLGTAALHPSTPPL